MENYKVSIVMYHYVRNLGNSRYPNIKGLDLAAFREQIDFFKKKYTFITCEQLMDTINNKEQLPKNSMLLTFDDGYIDHFVNVFPILIEKGIQGFFSMPGKVLAERKLLDVNKIHFILASTPISKLLPLVFERLNHYRIGNSFPSNEELYHKLAKANRFDCQEVVFVKRLFQVELEETIRNEIVSDLFKKCVAVPEETFVQELYMSLDQLKLMKRSGMCFGIHGYDHYWLNKLTPKALEKDIENALNVMDGIVNPKEWICCYPYGSYSEDVIHCIKKHGAVAGFSTDVNIANLDKNNKYALPRLDTNDFPPKGESYKNYVINM